MIHKKEQHAASPNLMEARDYEEKDMPQAPKKYSKGAVIALVLVGVVGFVFVGSIVIVYLYLNYYTQ
jgi:hypothetical protein